MQRKCLHPECTKQPVYGVPGTKIAQFCVTHRQDGMVNVKDKPCQHPECTTRPNYGVPGTKIAKFCVTHRQDGMIDVNHKTCQHPECTTRPVYGVPGTKIAQFCVTHRQDGMIDVKDKPCQHPECTTQPNYGVPGTKIAQFCVTHRRDGMVDVKNKTCQHPECMTRPVYGVPGTKIAQFCATHRQDGMVDVKHKTCHTHLCDTRVSCKYDGYCIRCYINMFPGRPVARNYKTKERAVVEFISENFPMYSWIEDHRIQDGCSRRRPDLLLDLGYQVLMIEIDEDSHETYDCSCENRRIMEISRDVNHRPIILVRFNPDSYMRHGTKNSSCWSIDGNGMAIVSKRKEAEWKHRLQVLQDQVHYWTIPANQTNKTVEVVQLFYDQ